MPVTASAAGKAFVDMLRVSATFETNFRHERQIEAIAAAKAPGAYRGRKPQIDPSDVQTRQGEEMSGPSGIARRPGIARSPVYRVLPEAAEKIVDTEKRG